LSLADTVAEVVGVVEIVEVVERGLVVLESLLYYWRALLLLLPLHRLHRLLLRRLLCLSSWP